MAFRILNVAEKNDAAKEIARIMSRGGCTRREGISRFNKIYEYQYNMFNTNTPCDMVMTSVSGHLMTFSFQTGYKNWQSCSPLALFQAPILKTVPENMVDIKKTLEREIRRCSILIIWTDCDREGENIGYEVINVCRNVIPRLDIYRARFSEITLNSITRACTNLTRPDELTSLAVDVRQELDLRIGAAFTRFQTLRLQKRFPEVLCDQLISYGSCQFPTLGFVVERYKEIIAFVSETFYKIKVLHVTEEEEVEFFWKRFRIFDELICQVLHQTCLLNPQAKVINQTSKPKSKWRPLALDTVELEKLASRKLKINAKETMRIAEKLYNQGYISYPRTETNMFKDIDLNELIEKQTNDTSWGQFAHNLLQDGANPRNGSKTDNAHPPIHPTKHVENLQGNEKRLYDFIVRHFLACCSKDAQGIETVVEISIAGEQFTAKGLTILAKNYLEVYPYEKWSDKTLPVYHIGDTFMPSSINMIDGQTNPPNLLNEADLIGLMEKHGIGTDATHAEHIEKIKTRMYVGVQADGTFVPGELGMGLVEGYDAMGFNMSKPELRAQLESDLKKICLGQKNKDVVLNEQIQQYKEMFIQTMEHVNNLDQALSQYFGQPEELSEDPIQVNSTPAFKCTLCHTHSMCIKKTQTEKFMMRCMSFPECTSRAFFPSFVLNAVVSDSLCSRCQPQLVHKIKFEFKRGSVPPTMDLEHIACVKCDKWLQEILDFKIAAGNNRGSQYTQRNTSSTRQENVSQVRQNQNQTRQFRGGYQPRGNGQKRGSLLPRNGNNRGSGLKNGTSQNLSIVCTCGETALKLTVKKQGPNTGRQFFKCGKRENSCNFFLWDDGDVSSGEPPHQNQQTKPRCCSICRQPGHNKNKCPRK